ncbi:hypothetical protein [Luteibacter sp.]|jgi:hypothetical protein|uniref:class I SAM-dependent methyltransferase n=1 Tax=Luteibacter sp. TaxID=1886636 RepID=UPI002F3F0505
MIKPLAHELHDLYADASKHSQYQSLPVFVAEAIGYQETIDQGWRGDTPRFNYIRSRRAPAPGEHWADFGANTGYFTLSLARDHPETQFTAIEANRNHANFITRIAEAFELKNVSVLADAVGLRGIPSLPRVDVMLHLNVIHHAGHDFDREEVPTLDNFGSYAVEYLKALRGCAAEVFFQMGSNWGGDKSMPLVPVTADVEKLALMAGYLVDSDWAIESVAYPERTDAGVAYSAIDHRIPQQLNARSIDLELLSGQLAELDLNKFPGEFYRRPLFHCRRGE